MCSLRPRRNHYSNICRLFGPNNIPILQVGYRGRVEVDSGFHMRIAGLEDYRPTQTPNTWAVLNRLASEFKGEGLRIALFSATPQGGGVALMRHALVRLSRLFGLNIEWYLI